jgi:hypothetical protein
MTPEEARARVMSHVQAVGECWLWTGCVGSSGYGRIGWREDGIPRTFQAHRVAYGPIPDGFHVHHTCGERLCVNPSHMRVLTQREHNRLHAPERCKRGLHWLDETGERNGNGRTCRVCRLERQRAYKVAA